MKRASIGTTREAPTSKEGLPYERAPGNGSIEFAQWRNDVSEISVASAGGCWHQPRIVNLGVSAPVWTMRLDPFICDYRAFMDELVDTFESERTRYYLDTSLLMWLIRLGPAAHAEFLTWCRSRPEKAVRVPVCAAHELHHHPINGTVSSNFKKVVSDTEKKFDEFVRLALERADEAACQARGYAGRDFFMTDVEQSFARVRKLAKVVSDDSGVAEAADEVVAFVTKSFSTPSSHRSYAFWQRPENSVTARGTN